jgi:hypothetical protein
MHGRRLARRFRGSDTATLCVALPERTGRARLNRRTLGRQNHDFNVSHEFATRGWRISRPRRPQLGVKYNNSVDLRLLASTNGTSRSFSLDRGVEMTLGSAKENDIVIPAPGISRLHARVKRTRNRVRITDVGSKNGLIYGGRRVAEVDLVEGDTVYLGRAAITIAKLSADDITLPSFPVSAIQEHKSPKKSATHEMLVFLCHAKEDHQTVQEIYDLLRFQKYRPWLDSTDLLAGQAWELEIESALRRCDAVVVCLSSRAVSKRGYVQREIRFALQLLAQQPEGAIFVVPIRLEPCDVPQSLKHLHYIDLFAPTGRARLLASLRTRAYQLGS